MDTRQSLIKGEQSFTEIRGSKMMKRQKLILYSLTRKSMNEKEETSTSGNRSYSTANVGKIAHGGRR